MMKIELIRKSSLFCLFFVLNFTGILTAQDERILPLHQNSVIKKAIADQKNNHVEMRSSSAPGDTLFLPFFEDFSTFTVWPDADKWTDSSSFVNFNFPLNPPTVGVATFDGINKDGNAYNSTNAGAVGLCDELTSRHLNLLNDENGLPYNSSDSIFLIFYYQRKGRGDNPETADSLVLHFFNPVSQMWSSVWKTVGATVGDTDFTKVKISITNPDFRQNGFRFRFMNYGAQTGLLDIWHVDYVFLNKFLPPDFDVIRDYAFVYQGFSLLNSYSAVPWKHFTFIPQSQQQSMVKSSADLTIRNNNDVNPFPVKVAGTIYDQYGNPTPIIGGGGLNSIVIPLNTNVSPPATLNTNTFFQDPGAIEQSLFKAVYEIGQTSGGVVDDFSMNDTLSFTQNFHDYYAYDDGSAELSYGINGIGAQLAYKFTTLKGDTLRAINMHFTQSGLSVTNQLFRLAIWTGNAAGPVGAPFYEEFNQTPNYNDSINGFFTYHTDPIYLPAGTWFFGFIQNNAVLLNLGLDVNTPADATKKFINTSGSWVNSTLPGMWMIRPVFDSSPLYSGIEDPDANSYLNVFPVPATNILNLETNGRAHGNMNVSISDVSGRTILAFSEFVSSIDVHELSSGLYFLNVRNTFTGKTETRKILITR